MKQRNVETIVEELSIKFNRKPKLIYCMLQIFINDKFSVEEAKKYIVEFLKLQT